MTIISRSAAKAKEWTKKGAAFKVADIYDTEALHTIFKEGRRIFVLNPPADPSSDTTAQELKTASSLVKALKYSRVEKVVVESTLGAQPGDSNGDLGVLFELEQQIKSLTYPHSIIRAAYYMSNWASGLETVIKEGRLLSFYPADFKMPMVAPADIGEFAARLLTEKNTPELNAIEGPESYSANDVAEAFAAVLGKEVQVQVVPPEAWEETYKSLGFSEVAAKSYSHMTRISLEGDYVIPQNKVRGKTTLRNYISELVAQSKHR